jgi:hypothetical protein
VIAICNFSCFLSVTVTLLVCVSQDIIAISYEEIGTVSNIYIVKPKFYVPTFCSFCDFVHFLYVPDQMSIRIRFPEIYAFPHTMPF